MVQEVYEMVFWWVFFFFLLVQLLSSKRYHKKTPLSQAHWSYFELTLVELVEFISLYL